MSDILRQVDEDLRKEKISNLWNKYGIYSILLIAIIVAMVIGFQLQVSFDKSKNEKLVESYISATNVENINKQISLFNDIVGSKNNYLSGLADLKISNLQLKKGDIEKSLFSLQRIIDNTSYDPILRNLATYLLSLKKINDLSEDELINFLNESSIQNSKYKFLFKELIAIKKLIIGENEGSIILFNELINLPDAPIDIKLRAEKFIEIAD